MPSRSPLPPAQLIALLGALAAFGPLAIDLYLPALPAIAHGLGASIEAVQSSVTVFLAGFSLGMLLYGPLSDRYGRRPVLLADMALFTVASLACWLANSVELLIAARFAQAMGGGAASVLARAVARDVFAPKEAIRQLSRMAMVTSVAPLLAPMLGSAVLAWGGWRSPFAVLCIWGVLSTAVVAWVLAETLPPERRGGLTLGQAFAAYGQMLRQPAAVGLLLAGGLSFAALAKQALAALGGVERNDVVAGLDAGHALAHLDHDARAFMAQNSGEHALGVFARQRERVGVAHASVGDFDQHLALLRRCARCSGWPSGCSTRSTCSARWRISASPARWCPTITRAWLSAGGISRSTRCG